MGGWALPPAQLESDYATRVLPERSYNYTNKSTSNTNANCTPLEPLLGNYTASVALFKRKDARITGVVMSTKHSFEWHLLI